MITVIGLGPGGLEHLTLRAYRLLKENHVYLRTAVHPVVDAFESEKISFSSFDDLYESAPDFDTLYDQITEALVDLHRKSDIIYAVPGNPAFYEESVKRLIAAVGEDQVEIVPGVSFIDVVADAILSEFDENFTVVDAYDISSCDIDPQRAHIITQVHNRYLLSEVKLKLLEVLPDSARIAVIMHAGTDENRVEWIELSELDHREGDHLMTLYIPKTEANTNFSALVETVRTLRAPGGCPWDQEQTHQSLKRYALEEAAEVVDAIDREDIDNLCEELGDLMLQVVLHAQIASELGEFDIHDVIAGITEKMIRRHPHVFSKESIMTSEEVLDQWENIKMVEKQRNLISEDMKNLPLSLSALLQSDKIQNKARSVGFDWDDPRDALEKVLEERDEVIDALGDREHLLEEIGDLLFACTNVARLCKIDPEEALRLSNKKFIERFEEMERLADEENKTLLNYDLDGLEKLWERAKNKEFSI